MMGYPYYGGMMAGFGGFGFLFCLVILIDLILLGVWLWQQIAKHKHRD
jgi:hypothetical protein